MTEALSQALSIEGLWLLAVGALLAGLVRGFSGFGTAMIYLPFAGQVLDPVPTIVSMLILDLIGPIPAAPRALREGHPRDVARLGAGALIGSAAGVAVLVAMAPETFRYVVSAVTLILLVLLAGGLRYRGHVSRPMIYATGGIAGLIGGATGVTGPPVILLYMARPLPPQTIRANLMLYLLLVDILMLGLFGWRGLLTTEPVLIGLLAAPLYLGALWVGSAIFDPARERLYRRVAYAIIAASALGGLPLWG